jgi:hypothetical protein
MKKLTSSRLQLFHPNFIIGQVLLHTYPEAEVALVNDSVWCSLIDHSGYGTITDVNNLVTKVFEKYEPLEKDGIVSLVAKNAKENEGPIRRKRLWSRLLASLRKASEKEKITWVKHVPVSDHATLF